MAEFLTDDEQLDRLKQWWRRNGLLLVIGAALAIGGLIGWRWYQAAAETGRGEAFDLYADWLEAEDEDRDRLADTIHQEFADTAWQAFVLLRQAQMQLMAEDMQAAVASLRRLLASDAPDMLQDLARLRLARLLQQQAQPEEALALLNAVRGPGYRWHALLLKGDIHVAEGDRSLAHEAYLAARAAMAELEPGAEDPLLDMKVNDTRASVNAGAPAANDPVAGDGAEDVAGAAGVAAGGGEEAASDGHESEGGDTGADLTGPETERQAAPEENSG